MSPVWFYTLVFLAGLSAGFINVMAGGGSLLTIAALMFMGLDPSVANGTNRIGVLLAGVSGARAYHSEKLTDVRQGIIYGILTIPGALLGAWYAVRISDALFVRILTIVTLGIILTLFIPKREHAVNKRLRFLTYPALFLVGVYGGFVQAGVGFLIMATLKHLLNLDLIRVNMYKIWIVLVYTLPVIVIFAMNRQIMWIPAFVLSAGNMLGAWIAVKLSVRRGEFWVKVGLSAAMLLIIIKLIQSF